jgi:hypothetical protein
VIRRSNPLATRSGRRYLLGARHLVQKNKPERLQEMLDL